jgi:hypothetical protein
MMAKSNPYYIVAPPFTTLSAGIKSLHVLCDALNREGERAHILPFGDESYRYRTDITEPDLLTPILTQHCLRRHFDEGLAPILVYPEIVAGNPYSSDCVVRYVLNYPGLLGGDNYYSEDNLIFSYSKELASHTKHPENTLFIPVSDTQIFYPPEQKGERRGACFYAWKFKNIHGGQLLEITRDAFEITSGLHDSLSPQEIADLFRRSEIFYAYENTALITEAALCGCPTVLLPSDYLDGVIAGSELGNDGIAWGNEPSEVERARITVDNFYLNYQKQEQKFRIALKEFISKTQSHGVDRTFTRSHYMKLLPHCQPIGDLRSNRVIVNGHDVAYASIFRKLPAWLEKEIGSFLCTLGLRNDGEFLWNRGSRRQIK